MCLATMLVACIFRPGAAPADDPDRRDGLVLFSADTTIKMTLHAPWRALRRERGDPVAHPGRLEYAGDDGRRHRVGLTVERRGKSRLEICTFDPIRLRFPNAAETAGTLFDGARSLKVVTHCNRGRRWQQYYVLEMLAYRMYNLFTDRSFRVRPLSVVYVDTGRDESDGPHFAFLIENDDTVAERNGLEEIRLPSIAPRNLEPAESSRFALFQLMIGNVDWSSLSGPSPDECCHNAKLIGAGPESPIYALPYDFDVAGLVDASYAVPQQELPITRVTQRLFRGFCAHNATLEATRREFIERRRDVFRVLDEEPLLSDGPRRKAARFLERFFDILEDPDRFEREVTRRCRK